MAKPKITQKDELSAAYLSIFVVGKGMLIVWFDLCIPTTDQKSTIFKINLSHLALLQIIIKWNI